MSTFLRLKASVDKPVHQHLLGGRQSQHLACNS